MSILITTTSLPNGFNGVAYSQAISQTGGQAPIVWTKPTGTLPTGLSLNAGTGAITGTPTTPGLYTFNILATDDNADTDDQDFTIRVYAALAVTPAPSPGDDVVYVEGGSQLQFAATGGSGEYQWSVNGGNLINPSSGLLTAINGGSYTVTLVDTESGQVTTSDIVVTSQSQFCVETSALPDSVSGTSDACCEFNIECGDRRQLRIPSFHILENGERQPVYFENLVQTKTGEASALQSTSANSGATGNAVSFNRDALFEIITSYDMAQTANGEFAIGWSSQDVDATIESINHAVVWFTDTDRMIEVRHGGVAEADSQFVVAQGDAVSFGNVDGELKLYINSVLVFTSAESVSSCGHFVLDIGFEDSGKTIGGYVENLTWSVETSGVASEVGSIDANGVYTSPSNPIAGIVKVKGALNNANFFVNIRNIQATPVFTKAQPYLNGRKAHVWVTPRKATDNDVIRIASDGSPDAIQNPGMIYLGTLQGSATFAEEITRQDFDNDDGVYDTVVASESATLTGTFQEVRDLDKLATIMQHATKYPQGKGVTELGVGGKSCGACDLRVALIIESGRCGGGWDVIYMPKVRNQGNLSLEIGKKANTGYPLSFKVLPDTTRQAGRQLYSIYQIPNCGDVDADTSCE